MILERNLSFIVRRKFKMLLLSWELYRRRPLLLWALELYCPGSLDTRQIGELVIPGEAVIDPEDPV